MVISSARLIWLISWATRWATGARDDTQGQLAPACPAAPGLADAADAANGTATTAAAATASAATRPRRYLR